MKNDFERQLDEIRIDLYERTKDLTNGETVHITNENAKKIAERHGIILTKSAAGYAEKKVM